MEENTEKKETYICEICKQPIHEVNLVKETIDGKELYFHHICLENEKKKYKEFVESVRKYYNMIEERNKQAIMFMIRFLALWSLAVGIFGFVFGVMFAKAFMMS